MKALLLLLLSGVVLTPGSSEIIHLGDGREIKAPVIKETAEKVFVDLGFTVLGIPTSDIVRREVVQTEEDVTGEAAVDSGTFYRTARQREVSVKENIGRVSDAVVLIRTPSGSGSGFIINPDGYLITNAHVIEQETEITVTLFVREDGGIRKQNISKVRIVGMNGHADLALLKLEGDDLKDLPSVPLAVSESRVGETTFAIGNPLGMERTVSEGIISTLNRPFEGLTYLQITTQINPGNSGGPLFNLKGEVIGVTNMKLNYAEGVSFAIPVARVIWFLKNRQAFVYDKDNSNTGYRYLAPPRKRKTSQDTDTPENETEGKDVEGKSDVEAVETQDQD